MNDFLEILNQKFAGNLEMYDADSDKYIGIYDDLKQEIKASFNHKKIFAIFVSQKSNNALRIYVTEAFNFMENGGGI